MISVAENISIEQCMKTMIVSNVRHLFVREIGGPEESGKIVGLISVKDIVKCSMAKQLAVANKLYSHVRAMKLVL